MVYKIGSTGPVVKQIQTALGLIPDGSFGPLTKEALVTWQREHNLTADGIAGPSTLARLIPQRLVKSKRVITDIVVHCTATVEGKDFTADDIRKMHKAQGWSDIGYHYVVRIDGTVENGRDVNLIGSHVAGHNSHSIGVVYVGGLDKNKKAKDTRTEEQKASLLSLLMDLRKLYPNAKISGHRDFPGVAKACPCFDATHEYKNL